MAKPDATDPDAQVQIPPEAIARWNAVEGATPLALTLTKDDLDNLLLGLRNIAISQSQIITALSAHTAQEHEQCMDAIMTANTLCMASFNRINALISTVMSTAAPVKA